MTGEHSMTRRIVAIDLDKPRGVTRTKLKGLGAKVEAQLYRAVANALGVDTRVLSHKRGRA